MTEPNYKHILVPVDGSDASQRVIGHAVYLARLSGAKLTLLTVTDLNKKLTGLDRVFTGGYVPAELKEESWKLLMDIIRGIPSDIKAEPRVEIGAPPETISTVAENGDYDLVVMGSRGLNNVETIVLGGVSSYVIHHTTKPVLIVR